MTAHDGLRANSTAGADARAGLDHNVRGNHHIVADLNLFANNRPGLYPHVGTNDRRGIDNGARVY